MDYTEGNNLSYTKCGPCDGTKNSQFYMENEFFLTTIDNPFDPFKDFEKWDLYDKIQLKYDTLDHLARFAHISDGLSVVENEKEIERAIDEIIKYDFLNVYRKIVHKKENINFI